MGLSPLLTLALRPINRSGEWNSYFYTEQQYYYELIDCDGTPGQPQLWGGCAQALEPCSSNPCLLWFERTGFNFLFLCFDGLFGGGERFAQPSEITVQTKLTVHLPILECHSIHITSGESRFCHFVCTSQGKQKAVSLKVNQHTQVITSLCANHHWLFCCWVVLGIPLLGIYPIFVTDVHYVSDGFMHAYWFIMCQPCNYFWIIWNDCRILM